MRTMSCRERPPSRVCQRGRDFSSATGRTHSRPGGDYREEFEQRAETVLAKSESERNAGAVFGQFSETERLETDGESESAEKEEEGRREITRRENGNDFDDFDDDDEEQLERKQRNGNDDEGDEKKKKRRRRL